MTAAIDRLIATITEAAGDIARAPQPDAASVAVRALRRVLGGLHGVNELHLLATMAASIAAGIEANQANFEMAPDGRSWGTTEEVAGRAVAIARAILAEVTPAAPTSGDA
jgi:hypothetical protein